MAESLSTEQIEERRTNLRAFRSLLEMDDDAPMATTLLMQEEWLETVDELQGYARDAHTLRGLRTLRCLLGDFLGGDTCTDFWKKSNKMYCAPCYLRDIHKPVTEDEEMERLNVPTEEEEPKDTDELLRRHWQSEAFDPAGEDVLEDWPDEEDWREHFENTPVEDPRTVTPDAATSIVHAPKSLPVIETECGTAGQSHVWVKVGRMDEAKTMHWNDVECLRCHIPVPVADFEGEEEFTDL